MNEEDSTSTLEEALACIQQQFMEPDGLLARIERGEEIHAGQIEMITHAFQTMHSAWQEKEVVPKEAVQVVRFASESIPRLERSLQLYPQSKEAIELVLSQVRHWMDMIFLPPSRSEETAFVLVCQHLLGTRPFSTELLMGRINEDALGELLGGLKILAQAWQTRTHISKLAAYAMLCAPWDFDEAAERFSGSQLQRLHEIEQQVTDSITRCLS